MPLMQWNDRLSVGVEVFDGEHKKLVGMLNDLSDAMQAGHGNDALGKILSDLVSYTVTHFAHEEQDMDKYGYPDAAEHKKIHRELEAQAADVQKKFEAGASATLSFEVLNFLKNWLLKHIQVTDKKFGAFLLEKGAYKKAS